MVPISIKTMKLLSLYGPPGSFFHSLNTQGGDGLVSGWSSSGKMPTLFWKIRFSWWRRIWYNPFLLAYVATGVSSSRPWYPVVFCGWYRRHRAWRLTMYLLTAQEQWPRDQGISWLGAMQNTIVWFPIFGGDTSERKYSRISPMAQQWCVALWHSDIKQPAEDQSAKQCGSHDLWSSHDKWT